MLPLRRLLVPAALAGMVLLAGCRADTPRTPQGTTATRATAAAPTTSASTRSDAEVLLAAFRRSWQVYADALRRLDTSRLPSAFAGRALRAVRSEVAEQKAKRQPVRISVEHHPKVLLANASDGVVQDHGVNHSVILNPATGQAAEPDPNERFSEHRSFKLVDGTWKVVEIIEEQPP
jgi:hypothetical protein